MCLSFAAPSKPQCMIMLILCLNHLYLAFGAAIEANVKVLLR